MATTVSPAGSWVDGTDYGHVEWRGESRSYTSQHGCGEGYILKIAAMPTDWDNRVRSAQRGSACEHWVHYEDTQFNGSAIDCNQSQNCLEMGSMAAQTSSEKWHD